MPRLTLLLLLGLFALPLAFVRPGPASGSPGQLPDLTGRWRVESVLIGGQQSVFQERDAALVFTTRSVEYVSPQPAWADTFSVS